jgi:hypothetical protein
MLGMGTWLVALYRHVEGPRIQILQVPRSTPPKPHHCVTIRIPFLPLASEVWASPFFNYRGATHVPLVWTWRRDMENGIEFLVRAAAY